MKKVFSKIVDVIFLEAEVKAANLVRSQGQFFKCLISMFIFKYYVLALVYRTFFLQCLQQLT